MGAEPAVPSREVDPLVVTTKTLLDILGNLRLRGVKAIVIDLERNQVDYKR